MSENVEIDRQNPVSRVKNGTVYLRTQDGSDVRASDVTFGDERDNLLAAEGVHRMSPSGISGMLENYDAGKATAEEYAKAYMAVYNRARAGMNVQQAVYDSQQTQNALTQEAAMAAYAAGERMQTVKIIPMTREEKTRRDAQLKLVEAINQKFAKTGVKIEMVDRIEGYGGQEMNGRWDSQTNTIQVSKNASENAYAYIAMHELTHAMKSQNASEFEGFSDWVTYYLNENGQDADALVRSEMIVRAQAMGLMERQKSNLSVEEQVKLLDSLSEEQYRQLNELAQEEVVCNTVPAILQNENVLMDLYQTKPTLFEKIKNFLKDFIDAVRGTGKDLSRTRAFQQMEGLAKDTAALEDIYNRMVKMAENAKEGSVTGKKVQEKFSLKEDVEETRDLIAVHNLTEDNINAAMDIGGIAMPSIAVVRAEQGHSMYGPISIVVNKDTIDPQRANENELYGADAWTPTFPKVQYEADEETEKRIREKYKIIEKKIGDKARPLYSYAYSLEDKLDSEGGKEGILEKLKDDEKMMQVYLADNGIKTIEDIKTKEIIRMDDVDITIAKYMIDQLGEETIKRYRPFNSGGWMKTYGENLMEAYRNLINQNVIKKENLGSDEGKNARNMLAVAYRYAKNGAETIKESVDIEATNKAIRKATNQKEYEKWLENLFDGAEKRKGIRNNVEYYTKSGEKRSFEQTHWEMTLENAVKAMKLEDKTGAGTLGKSIEGAAVKKYESIGEMKADSGRLGQVSEEEYEAKRKEFRKRFGEIAAEYSGGKDLYDAMDTLVEAVQKNTTEEGYYKEISRYSDIFKPNKKVAHELYQLVSEMKDMPTKYFEAKPRRAIGFEEMTTAIVPDNINEKTKRRMQQNGMYIIEYKAGDEGDRLKKLNSEELDRYKFSLKEDSDFEYDEDSNLTREQQRQVATPEFKRWFGDSKVVDEDGKPLVVYHGTDADFTVFDREKLGQYTSENTDNEAAIESAKVGFWFSENDLREKTGNKKAMEVYLSIENPMETDLYTMLDVLENMTADEYRAELEEEGYDGLIVTDQEFDNAKSYVVFKPNQIKSATDNVGTFDYFNPDIRYSLKETDEDVKKQVELTGEIMRQTGGYRLTEADAERVMRRVTKEFGSQADVSQLTKDFARVMEYARQENADMNQVDNELLSLADRVLENSAQMDTEREQEMKPIREKLRKTAISLTDRQKAEAASLTGSLGAFRRALFGRVNLSQKNGVSLDSVWSELSDLSPTLFQADATEGDMPRLLMEAVDATKPVFENQYSMDSEEMSQYAVMQMMDQYMQLPGVKTAAKNQQRMGLTATQYREIMDAFRQKSEKTFQDAWVKVWMQKEKAGKAEAEARYREWKQDKRQEMRDWRKEQQQAMQEKYREWRRTDTETRKNREEVNTYRDRLERTTNTLLRWMEKPNQTQHIPEGLAADVQKVLTGLDFSGKNTLAAKDLGSRIDALAGRIFELQEKTDENGATNQT